MPGYSQTELDRALQPIRSADDRDGAVCVLGHLLTEQREAHSDERAGIITRITSAVQDFETRTALGTTAAHFAGSVGAQPLAQAAAPPAPPKSPPSPFVPPPAPAESACPPTLLADDMRSRLNPTASMRRELARAGLASSATPLSASHQSWRGVVDQQYLRTANPHAAKPPGVDVLRGGTAVDMRASMEREIRRAGLTPNR